MQMSQRNTQLICQYHSVIPELQRLPDISSVISRFADFELFPAQEVYSEYIFMIFIMQDQRQGRINGVSHIPQSTTERSDQV